MKNRISNIGKLLVVLLMLSACNEDFLDLQPLDQVLTTNFYQTEEQAFQALVAVYDALTYQAAPGVAWAPFVTVADILSDDAHAGGGDANDGMLANELNTHRISTTNPIVHSIWVSNYVGIYRANLFLEIIDGINAPAAFKERTIAEAKFLRAYFYLELVRYFENIPLLTRTLRSPSEYNVRQSP
ncbi:MAG TPA: hypothetical protein DCM62_00555, partial [Bacteroidales bacterium]|nr:hypothetical protein [Bacteroidales bacterium]